MATRTIVEARRNPNRNSVYPVEFSPGLLENIPYEGYDYEGLSYHHNEPQVRRWYPVFDMAEAVCKSYEKEHDKGFIWDMFDCCWRERVTRKNP